MKKVFGRKIEMGARAQDFGKAHPTEEPRVKEALAVLDELLRRVDAILTAVRDAILSERSAAQRKQDLRRSATFDLLRHLVLVGRLAGEEDPTLAGKFHLRSPDATHKSFQISTRQMLDLAISKKETMLAKGLMESVLTELGSIMTQFDEATTAGRNGRNEHVRANRELEAVANQVVATVGVLDGLYRYLYRNSPDLRLAWEKVRFIGPKSEPEKTPDSGAPPAPAA